MNRQRSVSQWCIQGTTEAPGQPGMSKPTKERPSCLEKAQKAAPLRDHRAIEKHIGV